MRIAISGATCVGKTTLARGLSLVMNVGARHCGEIVRAEAVRRGVSPYDLPLSEHARIDGETRQFAEEQKAWIIEGKYVEAVLTGTTAKILGVVLVCTEEVRSARFIGKYGLQATEESRQRFEAHEVGEKQLVASLYKSAPQPNADLVVDTSLLSAAEVLSHVLKACS